MKWQLSGQPIPAGLPYAAAINMAALDADASPCALYAIGWRETIGAERSGWLASVYPGKTAATVVSPDGGHGVYQLTDSFPADWDDPYTNALYAANTFYNKAIAYWLGQNMIGTTLLRVAADTYNAGVERVLLWHGLGNADNATTGRDYGEDVVQIYSNLVAGRDPDFGRP